MPLVCKAFLQHKSFVYFLFRDSKREYICTFVKQVHCTPNSAKEAIIFITMASKHSIFTIINTSHYHQNITLSQISNDSCTIDGYPL